MTLPVRWPGRGIAVCKDRPYGCSRLLEIISKHTQYSARCKYSNNVAIKTDISQNHHTASGANGTLCDQIDVSRARSRVLEAAVYKVLLRVSPTFLAGSFCTDPNSMHNSVTALDLLIRSHSHGCQTEGCISMDLHCGLAAISHAAYDHLCPHTIQNYMRPLRF
jgi:hypothetical protein